MVFLVDKCYLLNQYQQKLVDKMQLPEAGNSFLDSTEEVATEHRVYGDIRLVELYIGDTTQVIQDVTF